MRLIILEGVLFAVLIAAGGALVYYGLLYFTPVGLRLRQQQNRKRIERAADLACPIHGPCTREEMVRLPTGEEVCPHCYQETMQHDQLDR